MNIVSKRLEMSAILKRMKEANFVRLSPIRACFSVKPISISLLICRCRVSRSSDDVEIVVGFVDSSVVDRRRNSNQQICVENEMKLTAQFTFGLFENIFSIGMAPEQFLRSFNQSD